MAALTFRRMKATKNYVRFDLGTPPSSNTTTRRSFGSLYLTPEDDESLNSPTVLVVEPGHVRVAERPATHPTVGTSA